MTLRIALPNKGRLADDTRQLFVDAGLDVRASSERALSASLGGEFEAIFVRAQDVPEFIADGAADAGVTGWDLVSETQRPLQQLLDLGFGACRVVVAAKEDAGIATIADIPSGSRVATVFPRITRNYFDGLGKPVEIVPMSGAAEIAPHLGIANLIVDITSTGSTLRTNGLVEVGTVLCSTARLVAARDAASRPLDELVMALASVIRARGQRYLMANVPKQSLNRVKEVLPGLNGPTVIDIVNGGRFVAVHAVVAAEGIYRTIATLKQIGAEGVLVTRIERLMP
jgi:ATP phosphoribosyltransferase